MKKLANEHYYSPEKLQKFKAKYGEDLTYSIYRELRRLGLIQKEIAEMYGISRTSLYKFVKSHKEVLGA